MGTIPESFIREILKVSTQPGMISFAGGLPNPEFFPSEKIALAAERVLSKDWKSVLQYAPTEGYLPLRDYIAQRQSGKERIAIHAEDILILNGAQQGLDLAAKLFVNKGTNLLVEAPTYLGAIQAFSVFEPAFHEVEMIEGGPDMTSFRHLVQTKHPALFYCVPNFQNPTGNTYDLAHRHGVVAEVEKTSTIVVEDDPYGEIFFSSERLGSLHSMLPEQTIYLGSFSKIVSPGMRLGWATGNRNILKKMAIAKQATDLHSNNFAQRVLYQFLVDNPIESHLQEIRTFYQLQAENMVRLMKQYFPKSVRWIEPTGGMFTWLTLPDNINSGALLEKSMEEQVLFVPGQYFFTQKGKGENSQRMNFSNPSPAEMERGIKILGDLIKTMADTMVPAFR